ncbi:MAG: FUSC family protein [Terriglobales bacterium]
MAAIEGQGSGKTASEKSPTGPAVSHGVMLAVCCFISYWIITDVLAAARSVSRDDEFLGGMWAVVATVFVFRYTYEESARAALSRMYATLVSFALCFVYLLILPFRPLGLAVLIAIGAIVMSLVGQAEDIVTTGITTTVVMVVAGMSPEHAWKQPILRLIDTVVGTAVGIVGARIGLALTGSSQREAPRRAA